MKKTIENNENRKGKTVANPSVRPSMRQGSEMGQKTKSKDEAFLMRAF